MVADAENLATNLQSLLNISSKAIEVLKNAKKKDNNEISKIVGISHTIISTIMNRANRFGYIEKSKGKWIKTKEIKGIDLYKAAKINFKSSINKGTSKSSSATRIDNPLKPLLYYREATEMMDSYRDIFCLEATIRDFLRNIFVGERDWLNKRLDDDIKRDIENAKKEPYYSHKIRKDDLEYVTLGQLLKIIISNKNWKEIIPYLNETNKNKFINTFEKVLPSRNVTMHSVHLDKGNRELVKSRVKEISFLFKF